MIISRTPFRVSFFGGGTDYPGWYQEHGGAVLAATIDKYCYLTCRYLPPFFEHRIRLVYSKIELCQSLDEVVHPAVRETLRFLDFQRGVEIHHDGDLPARSGIGSSSAFTVGLLHALHALMGRIVSKHQLATDSIHLEQEVLRETVGCQDQVTAAYGGLNHILFNAGGGIEVRPLLMPAARKAELNAHLMLFYTGIMRTAAEVASSYVPEIGKRSRQLHAIAKLVDAGVNVLTGEGDLADFGHLLHESWVAKASLSKMVSNSTVDEIYEDALAAGAIGGKLLGAGGGGFMLLFVRPENQERVRTRLDRLVHVPIKFENMGSSIIYYDLENDYSQEDLARKNGQRRSFQELSTHLPTE